MKKKFFMLPVMAMLLFLLPVVFWAKTAEAAEETGVGLIDSGACGELHYDYESEESDLFVFEADESVKYRLYKDGTMVISGNGVMGDFNTWTDCCTQYKMKELMPWYDCRADIKKVVVENGVTTIGNCAFYGCKNLESIQWADSIEKVGGFAFYKCSSLKEVELPSYVKRWSVDVFAECTGLKKVSLDTDFQFHVDKNLQIACDGYEMFKDCTALEEIVLPKSMQAIPSYFVEGCTSLKTFSIPDNIIYWGSCPPSLCKGKYVLPKSVQTLADGAFASCSDLEELILPEGLVYIGKAFEGCSSLKTLKIPKSVMELSHTFYNCTGMESIVIPDTVQNGLVYYRRNDSVFEGCSNLKSVVLPDNMKYIGDNFFKNCSSLKKVKLPKELKEIGWSAFSGCSSLTDIKIPNTVNNIGLYAFSGCTSLEEIDLPKGVDSLSDKVFYNCKKLKRVTVHAEEFIFYGEKIFYGCKNLSGITTYIKKAKKFFLPYSTFDGVKKEVTVYVPKESINAYKKWLKGTPGLKDIKPMQ